MADYARALLEQYVATQDAWSEHGQTCQDCPCVTCEEWFDRDAKLLAEARRYLQQFDGTRDG